MNPILLLMILGGVAAGLYYLPRKVTYQGQPTAFDPRMDAATTQALDHAIGVEMDPAVLRAFAAKLQAAGYYAAADALHAKADRIEQGLEF